MEIKIKGVILNFEAIDKIVIWGEGNRLHDRRDPEKTEVKLSIK